MKKFVPAMLLVLASLSAMPAIAGDKKRASLIPVKGYWVLTQHKEKPKQVTVYFYSQAHLLIGKEIRTLKKADISKKKVLRSLNKSLANAIAWTEPIF